MVGSPKSDVRCYYFIRKTPNGGLVDVNFTCSDLPAALNFGLSDLRLPTIFSSTEKRRLLFPGISCKLQVYSADFAPHYLERR